MVEGRAAASLARVFRIVSCFIYNNETTKELSCQALNEHSRVKFQSSTLPKDWVLQDPETHPSRAAPGKGRVPATKSTRRIRQLQTRRHGSM